MSTGLSAGIFNTDPNRPSNVGQPTSQQNTIAQLLAGLNPDPTKGEKVADVGSVISALGTNERNNRLSGAGLTQGYDQMMLQNQLAKNQYGLSADQVRNANETDALKKLQQTAYLTGGGANLNPTSITLGGQQRMLPTFSFGPIAPSAVEQQGASALQGQLINRLGNATPRSDWSYQPTPASEYAKQGLLEKIGNYGGAGTSIAGGLMDIFGKAQGAANAGNSVSQLLGAAGKIPGLSSLSGLGSKIGSFLGGSESGAGLATNVLGKAVPIVGAVTGGLGLLHNQGAGRNALNGASTGASIGTMIAPGIGTGIGAGIGALAGLLRGIGGPSQQELQGRDAANTVRQLVASSATPQQMQEAQQVGGNNAAQQLTAIVLRDQLAQKGGDPALAAQLADQLWRAEKEGPQAVQKITQQIQQLLG